MSEYKVDNRIVSFDIETSGLTPTKHAILSIGAEHLATGETFYAEVYHDSLVVSPSAMRVNGLDICTLDDHAKRTLPVVETYFNQWLCDIIAPASPLIPLGYNVGSFDMQFVAAQMPLTMTLFGHRAIDLNSVQYARDTCDGEPLGTTKAWLKSVAPNVDPHNALADARNAAREFRILVGAEAV